MSYLSRALGDLLTRHNLKPAEVAKATQIEPAKLSRWRSGEQIHISPEDLEKLSASFNDPGALAILLKAHLLDECHGRENLVRIEIAGDIPEPALEASPVPYGRKLPPKIEHALNVIAREITSDKDLKNMILSLANLYEKGTLD